MSQSDAVSYAREAGRALYESYGSDTKDGGWSFREDGTLEDHVFGVAITKDGDVFGRHADVTAYLKAAELTGTRSEQVANFESHHLLPVEVLEQVGIAPDDGVAVAVDSLGHMRDVHSYGGLETGLVFTDVDQLRNYYRGEYSALGAPEWATQVDDYIQANREAFEKGLAAVSERLDADEQDPLAEPESDVITDPSDHVEPDGDSANDMDTDRM